MVLDLTNNRVAGVEADLNLANGCPAATSRVERMYGGTLHSSLRQLAQSMLGITLTDRCSIAVVSLHLKRTFADLPIIRCRMAGTTQPNRSNETHGAVVTNRCVAECLN
jgi:hypothetical protein